MTVTLGSQRFFQAIGTLLLLVVFFTLLNSVSAVPQQITANAIVRRAGNAPGIGVELEAPNISIQGRVKLTGYKRETVKGVEMKRFGIVEGRKTNWKLTAEVGDDNIVRPEAIIDGL